jgi:hypothetical protein
MAKSLFPELDFTRENVLAWAEERVSLEPVVIRDPLNSVGGAEPTNIANSVELVLRAVLNEHYLRQFCQYDKSDLIEELMTYVKEGLNMPTSVMTKDQLLDEIMTIGTPSDDGGNCYDFETMDDFVRDMAYFLD